MLVRRNRCGEPMPAAIAINDSFANPLNYADDLRDTVSFWTSETKRADAEEDHALLEISQTILRSIGVGAHDWRQAAANSWLPNRMSVLDRARRLTLGALGISMLLRSEWEYPVANGADSAGGQARIGLVLDMVVPERGWNDFRVHTPVSAEGTLFEGGEQWYRDRVLLVRQVRPVEPTDYLVNEFLPGMGINEPDFSRYETIYPYVVTR